MTPQDQESAFGRGFRKAYEASDDGQAQIAVQTFPTHRHPPPVDYTMPILAGCLTALLIALVLAMALRGRKP